MISNPMTAPSVRGDTRCTPRLSQVGLGLLQHGRLSCSQAQNTHQRHRPSKKDELRAVLRSAIKSDKTYGDQNYAIEVFVGVDDKDAFVHVDRQA